MGNDYISREILLVILHGYIHSAPCDFFENHAVLLDSAHTIRSLCDSNVRDIFFNVIVKMSAANRPRKYLKIYLKTFLTNLFKFFNIAVI